MKILIKYLIISNVFLIFFFFLYEKKIRTHHLEYNIQNSKEYITKSISHKGINLSNFKNIILGDSRSLNLNIKNSVNLSVGGQTLKLLIKNINSLDFPDSSNIIVNIGINDILFSSPLTDVTSNFEKLVQILDVKTIKSTFYFIEILPINDSGFFFQKEKVNSKVIIVNSFLKKIPNLEMNNYNFLPLEALSENYSYFNDGIHLNLKGNRLFTSSVEDFINE